MEETIIVRVVAFGPQMQLVDVVLYECPSVEAVREKIADEGGTVISAKEITKEQAQELFDAAEEAKQTASEEDGDGTIH